MGALLRERYFDMLTACTYLSAVCEAGAPGAQLQAYKKIIDLADVVLCVYDTDIPATSSAEDRALAYAEGQHKSLVLLHPTELTTNRSPLPMTRDDKDHAMCYTVGTEPRRCLRWRSNTMSAK